MREGLEWRRSRCGAEQGEVKQCKGFALKPRKARPERSGGHARKQQIRLLKIPRKVGGGDCENHRGKHVGDFQFFAPDEVHADAENQD